jgi:hypothetical protein
MFTLGGGWQPVGREEPQRKSDWFRADFVDLKANSYSIGRKSGEI